MVSVRTQFFFRRSLNSNLRTSYCQSPSLQAPFSAATDGAAKNKASPATKAKPRNRQRIQWHDPPPGPTRGQFITLQQAAELDLPGARALLSAEPPSDLSDNTRLDVATMADAAALMRVQLPPWQPDEPAFWFTLVDGLFEMFDPAPSEKQKSTLVGTKIPIEVLKAHKKALMDPKPYSTLKATLSGTKVRSDAELFNELTNAKLIEEPSTFVRKELTTLAEIQIDGKPITTIGQLQGWLVKQLLERQLPPVVASAALKTNLDADNPQSYMDHVDAHFKAYQANQASSNQAASITPTSGEVAAVNSSASKRRSGGKKYGGAARDVVLVGGKCYYHHTYGSEAQKCKGNGCKDADKPLAPTPKKTT